MEKINRAFRAVIAHPIPEQQQRIALALEQSGVFTVSYQTHDGLDCLREVVATAPDLVVLDTVLEKLDGLETLRRLKEFGLSGTRFLMLTTYGGYLTDQALLAGADYCMLAPYSCEVLAQRACQLLLPARAAYSDEAIDQVSGPILRSVGALEKLKGYEYAADAIRILVRDTGLIRRRKVTCELYKVIAQHFNANEKQVERCLRTLTRRVLGSGDPELLEQYFGPLDPHRATLPNTIFLSTVARMTLDALKAAQRDKTADTRLA